jgi:hypothetical protein
LYFAAQALLLEYSAEQQQLRDKQKMLKSDWEKFKQQRQQMGSRLVPVECGFLYSTFSVIKKEAKSESKWKIVNANCGGLIAFMWNEKDPDNMMLQSLLQFPLDDALTRKKHAVYVKLSNKQQLPAARMVTVAM